MSTKPHCEPFEHDWDIELVKGDMVANTDIEMLLRCNRCHATIAGKVKR
jgi:hypothetical protein